jgi:2-iminobutanoate/2-iminopropanoate deaminase
MAVAMYLTWTANKETMATCEHVPCDGVNEGYGCPCPDADYTKYYYAAVLYGLTDCAFQTAASAVCAQDFVASGLAADAFALYRTFQSLGGVIGFGLSPMLSVHGGTTSDKDQLRTELMLTAAVGIAALLGLMVYSATPDTARTPVSTKDAPQPVQGAYSQAISAGGFLYLVSRVVCLRPTTTATHLSICRSSWLAPLAYGPVARALCPYASYLVFTQAGQIGLRPNQSAEDFKASGLSIEAQTEIACQNVEAVLKAGGCKPADMTKVTVFLADIGDFTRMNAVYKKHFVDAGFTPPARSAFAVAALPLGALVEIEAVAAMP